MKTLKIMIVSLLLVTQSYALSNSGKKALMGLGAVAILAYALEANSQDKYERAHSRVIYVDSHKKKHVKHYNKHHRKDNYRYSYNQRNKHKYYKKHNRRYNNHYSHNDRYEDNRYTKKHRKYNEIAVNHRYRDYGYRY